MIYCATNSKNGMKYVGKWVGPFSSLLKRHKRHAESGCRNYFHRAIRKYGWDMFSWEILRDGITDAVSLAESEVECISRLSTKAPNGYNMTDGGDGWQGGRHTEETKKKMSKSRQGMRSGFLGGKHTEEAKRIIGEKSRLANLGRVYPRLGPRPQETKEKIRQALKNRFEKMEHNRLGAKHTEEAKEKIRKANTGKRRSESVKEEMRKQMTGKKRNPHTEETKEKMRQAWVKRKARQAAL